MGSVPISCLLVRNQDVMSSMSSPIWHRFLGSDVFYTSGFQPFLPVAHSKKYAFKHTHLCMYVIETVFLEQYLTFTTCKMFSCFIPYSVLTNISCDALNFFCHLTKGIQLWFEKHHFIEKEYSAFLCSSAEVWYSVRWSRPFFPPSLI